ncbi:MAG: hypothetical protein JW838_14435 [Spirochaetes bacterium]|nr:hypothetical protein [Spirochaetota bacterium]
MGNDNEMMESRGRSLFLPDEIHDRDGSGQVYVLEEEFARSRRNRNLRLYAFLVAFTALLAGGVFLFSFWSEGRERLVDVDISDFEDLRLREVMSSARKRRGNIDVLHIELSMLEVAMMDEVLRVRRDFQARENVFLNTATPGDGIDARLRQLGENERRAVERIRSAYRARIRSKKAEIWSLEEAREEEERELEVKGANARLSNEDRLYALRMKQLRDKQEYGVEALKRYYDAQAEFLTSRYNPVLGGRVRSAMELGAGGASLSGGMALKDYDAILDSHGVTFDDFTALRKRIGAQGEVLKRLERVPYINSVPEALVTLDRLSGSIVAEYERIWSALAAALHRAEGLRERYDYPLEYVLGARKEQGIILDPRDPGDILVYMKRSLNVGDGRRASVYHGNRLVGTIRLYRIAGGHYRGRTVTLVNKKEPFRPINRVVLEAKL